MEQPALLRAPDFYDAVFRPYERWTVPSWHTDQPGLTKDQGAVSALADRLDYVYPFFLARCWVIGLPKGNGDRDRQKG